MRLEQVQKQSQKMIMTPQMQQGIQFLQLPLMELSSLIQQEMTENPVLEEITNTQEPSLEKEEAQKDSEVDFDDEFSRLSELDDEWKEYFRQTGSYTRRSDDEEKRRRFYEESITTQETLQEHLLNQLRLTMTQKKDQELGELLIGNLDENGYLTSPLEELAQNAQASPLEMERVLKILQTFHPVGVGARTLTECLLIQLTRLGKAESLEAKIIREHLSDLGKHNFLGLAKVLNIPLPKIQQAAEMIATLEPKPGRIFGEQNTQYAMPDIVVEKVEDEYVVVMNDERIPHVRISNLYRNLMKDKNLEGETKDYIRSKVQAGKWLVKNIQLRQQTIYQIASTLVKEQQAFFEHGVTHLKPLIMQTVATAIGMHESTVSRAIANKYMSTPRGLFQLKYFFTPGVQTQTGQNMSTTNIKEIIGELIAKEDSASPLSDQAIVEALKAKGIEVARRTVTKYRKELKILSSNLRKKYS